MIDIEMSHLTINHLTAIKALQTVRDYGSLDPTDDFNTAVNTLVDTIISLPADEQALLSVAFTNEVRELVSSLESARESKWASDISNSKEPRQTLHSFPYLENYNRIISREVALLKDSNFALSSQHRMLAIGSGPLPLTALQFHERTGVIVDQLDTDQYALELGRRVSQALAVPGEYIHANGSTVTLGRMYDVIFVAVLAGSSHDEKQAIIDNVLPSLNDNGRLLLRSAKGARGIIYPVVDITRLTGITLVAETHPDDIVINSSLVFKKR